jgi:hypothetical protein
VTPTITRSASTEFLAIEHVQLGMPPGGDDAARAFYAGALGLAERAPPPGLSGWWFHAGGVELHLNTEEGYRATRRVHPALHVRGLDALVARCAEAGFPVRWDTRYPGRRRCFVSDPFENQLELFEVDEEARREHVGLA